jgi:hypothetical protein
MEDDFSMEKPRIARLTGPNYRPWSVQVRRLLIGQSLWNVVSLGVETTIEPGSTGGSAAQSSGDGSDPKALGPSSDRTEVKDAKASTIIMSLCTQGALQHILLLGTAREQWKALETLYAPLGIQQLSAKIQAFTSYKPPGRGATVTVVATELSTLQYEIGTIDPTEKPSETLKISILFGAIRVLDKRFAPLILQLEISGTITNYSAIIARFSEYERRMGPKEALKESILLAKTGGKSPKFQRKCFNCGKQGYRKSDCKSKKVEKQDQEKSPSIGPLATPGGGRGLSPGPGKLTEKPIANASSAETSWMALEEPTYSRNDLL